MVLCKVHQAHHHLNQCMPVCGVLSNFLAMSITIVKNTWTVGNKIIKWFQWFMWEWRYQQFNFGTSMISLMRMFLIVLGDIIGKIKNAFCHLTFLKISGHVSWMWKSLVDDIMISNTWLSIEKKSSLFLSRDKKPWDYTQVLENCQNEESFEISHCPCVLRRATITNGVIFKGFPKM